MRTYREGGIQHELLQLWTQHITALAEGVRYRVVDVLCDGIDLGLKEVQAYPQLGHGRVQAVQLISGQHGGCSKKRSHQSSFL